jgi:2-dehydropantoate 2-reductase
MRICVYGAGAVGGHIAAKLSAAGHTVSIVARGDHLGAIRANGITLETLDRTISAQVNATEKLEECGQQDVIFVTLKAHALCDFPSRIVKLVSPDSLVVFAQNGLPWWYPHGLAKGRRPPPSIPVFDVAKDLLSVLRLEQIVGCVVQTSNEVVRPGVIVNASPRNALSIGHVDDRETDKLERLKLALNESGLDVPVIREIREAVWLKLLRNMSSSSIAAATLNTSGIIKRDPLLREIFKRIVRETMNIAQAYGYPLDHLANEEKLVAETNDVAPSLLQDYQRGRAMEIDELIFAPLAFGRYAGIETPTIDAVAAVARSRAVDKGLVSNGPEAYLRHDVSRDVTTL